MIPYSHQSISRSDIRAVVAALRSPWITQGPRVAAFEKSLARYVGARFAVSVSSGTAALHAAYAAAGIGPDDEIITSPLTFAATASAARWLGAKPVFVDIDPATGCINPNLIERAITRRTKVIVPVDYAGLPADLAACRRIARRHGLVLIEDAAHALGARYRGKRVGSVADLTTFSFHPVKSITTGEGGAVTTNNPRLAERLRCFRNHGAIKDPALFQNASPGAWYYEIQEVGLNYKLTDIQAALGKSQLTALPSFLTRRRRLARRYGELLQETPGIMLPTEASGRESAWHLYPIRFRGGARVRNRAYAELRAAGIGAQVHYIPVYRHPYYRSLGYKPGTCPQAEAFADSELSLPLYPTLTTASQQRVVAALSRTLTRP